MSPFVGDTDEKVTVECDVYVIALTVTNWHAKGADRRTVYFKSDRYSVYSGNLQVEREAHEGKPFKTVKGAVEAVKRLMDKGVIKDTHKPRVVRYTRTTVRRWENVA